MKKFADAFNGLKLALKHKAVMVQVVLGLCAIIGGIIIKLDYFEWLVFILCIGLVIMAEIINTSIEQIGNYLTNKNDIKIKIIKDLASASVLVISVIAFCIAVLTVLRRII